MPTILVADDNSNIQKMVTLALKDVGITVVAVSNGEAAVRKLPDLLPDLVLADIFMPVRNGYEVCEYMKADERFAHIPVILLVGAFDPLDEHEVERVHADGVLKKPFVPPTPLITMVTSLLEKFAAAAKASATAALSANSMGFDSPASRVEKTQQLSPRELAAATNQPAPPAEAPTPEPEAEQFASQPAVLNIDAAHSPLAFQDMLGGEEEPSVEEEEAVEEKEETEEAVKDTNFEASSVSGYHFPGELDNAPAAATPATHEESEDHWGGIKEEMKHPAPEEPPIPVQFGESAPLEIITDEVPQSAADVGIKPDPALVASANDWMSSHLAPAPPSSEVAPGVAPEPSSESLRMESESPAAPPEPAPTKSVEDTQKFFVSPKFAATPLEKIARDLHEDAIRAAAPGSDTEETQQFQASAFARSVEHERSSAEPAKHEPAEHQEQAHRPAEEPAHAEPPAYSTWGRVEEIMIPAVPVIAAVAAEVHSHAHTDAPAVEGHKAEPVEAAPAPASSRVSPGESEASSDLLVQSIAEKVLKQLDPATIEKISRELVRPLIEALIRREVDKG